VWNRPAPLGVSGVWQAGGQWRFFFLEGELRVRGKLETTARMFLGGLKGFSVEDRHDRTERTCLSGPDWTAPRDALVREGAGFQGAWDFLSKSRPVSVKGQTEDV
jgi:hypothetical protein